MTDPSRYAGTFLGDSERTTLCPPRRGPSPSCESPSGARRWVECLHELRATRAERMQDAAVAIIVRQPGGNSRLRTRLRFLDENSDEPLALVLGRHPCCDVPGIRDASLRHAVVLAWPRSREPIEVVDLRSTSGLVVSRGRTVQRLKASGPIRFCAGSDDITVLYAAPESPLEVDMPDELDGWIDVERRRARGELSDDGFAERGTNVSFVRRVGGSFVRAVDGTQLAGAAHEVIPARPDQLRDGLLLGRYGRCDRSMMFATDSLVSRVHALVIQRRGRLHVVDVGSTNGTVIVDTREGREMETLDEQRRTRALAPWEEIRVGARRVAFEMLRAPSIH